MEVVSKTLQYLQQGGWIMIPLAVTSIILWTLMLERMTYLRRLRSEDITIEDAIHAVRNGGMHPGGEGLRARLVSRFVKERSGFPRIDVDILKRIAMQERAGLGRYLAMIGVLVSVAPLLGLLGTVLGMIETFQVISLFGTGNANAMANGISIALITTEAGLLIAVPGLLMSGMLLVQSNRLSMQLEEDVTILSRIVRRPQRCSNRDKRRFGRVCDRPVDDRRIVIPTGAAAEPAPAAAMSMAGAEGDAA